MPKNNSLSVIIPFDYVGMWVFSDPVAGLSREPFVAGADVMITKLVERQKIKDAKNGFRLMFAGTPFPDMQIQLDWVDTPLLVNGLPIKNPGNTYHCKELNQEGWLCPALFRYFDVVPEHLYASAQPLGKGPEAKALRKQIEKERAFVVPSVMGHREPVGYIGGGEYHKADPNDIPTKQHPAWWRDWDW